MAKEFDPAYKLGYAEAEEFIKVGVFSQGLEKTLENVSHAIQKLIDDNHEDEYSFGSIAALLDFLSRHNRHVD